MSSFTNQQVFCPVPKLHATSYNLTLNYIAVEYKLKQCPEKWNIKQSYNRDLTYRTGNKLASLPAADVHKLSLKFMNISCNFCAALSYPFFCYLSCV